MSARNVIFSTTDNEDRKFLIEEFPGAPLWRICVGSRRNYMVVDQHQLADLADAIDLALERKIPAT